MTNAEYLKSLADHFAPRDWDYTRKTDIVRIRYGSDSTGRFTFRNRLKRALKSFFSLEASKDFLISHKSLRDHLLYKAAYFKVQATLDDNRPEGELDNGNIIVHWEEDGEYLQMVQPTVGSLLADFLIADPEHPHAKIITAELDRLHTRYRKRIKDGEVS